MRRVETILIGLALVFYAWFVHRLGVRDVLGNVRLVGWGLGVTIALETVARVVNTLGWRVTIVNYPRTLSFARLFASRIAGEAVDYVTPSAQLGGQFVMAVMVRRKLKMAIGLATVVVATLAEAIGQIGFIAAALLISIELAATVRELLWPVLAGLALAVALALGFFIVQTKRPFSYLWKAAAKLKVPTLLNDEVRQSAAQADALLSDFYLRHRTRLVFSCLLYAAAWSIGPVEIYLLLKFLKQPCTLEVALLVEALGLLIERATFIIPAKLVSQEGGKALIMSLLGYPPGIGFVVGFLRRIKELAWVLLGLGALTEHRMVTERLEEAAERALTGTVEMEAGFAVEKLRSRGGL